MLLLLLLFFGTFGFENNKFANISQTYVKKKILFWIYTIRASSGLQFIKLQFILKLKIERNDWLFAATCLQAANHCALFWVWDCTQFLKPRGQLLFLFILLFYDFTRWFVVYTHKLRQNIKLITTKSPCVCFKTWVVVSNDSNIRKQTLDPHVLYSISISSFS